MGEAQPKNEVGLDGVIEAPPSEANVARYTGHVNSINCMCVLDDAKEAGDNLKTVYIFTGGYDHTARCFNAESGECLYVYRGHQSFVFSLKVNIEPQMSKKYADVIESTKWFLYTGSYDGTVKRWDVSTGECVQTYELEYGIENPRLRAGIVLLLELYENLFFTVSVDTVLRAWNRDDGEVNWESRDHRQSITGLQIRDKFETSDEFRIYESPAELFSCSTDRTVRVWEPLTGVCKRILRFDTQPLYAMYVRLDGALFVGAGASLIYCNGETGQARDAALPPPPLPSLTRTCGCEPVTTR
jgi:WD40 repeat protein